MFPSSSRERFFLYFSWCIPPPSFLTSSFNENEAYLYNWNIEVLIWQICWKLEWHKFPQKTCVLFSKNCEICHSWWIRKLLWPLVGQGLNLLHMGWIPFIFLSICEWVENWFAAYLLHHNILGPNNLEPLTWIRLLCCPSPPLSGPGRPWQIGLNVVR